MRDRDGAIEIGEDAAWLAAAVVLVASLGGAVVLAEWPLSGVPPDEPEEPHLVEPADGGTELWPYTARAHDFKSRTLGINVIFYGDPETVHTALTDRSELEWEEEPIEEGDADAEVASQNRLELDPEATELGDAISWVDAEGSVRYTYFETDDGGKWAEESYQLHAGTYFGQRRHIRAYDDPAAEWTAVQVHEEHWDWFRLRHTVTGISDSQGELEREFMDNPAAESVVRMPFENETADSDGWASGIHLASAVVPMLFLGLAGRSRKRFGELSQFIGRRHREILLGGGLFGLYTAVRWLGIGAEMAFPGVSPKAIAAPLYLLLVIGIPTIAYVFGKETDPTWAFAFAALGLGTAIVVDFAAMGVSVLPLRVILHRGSVLLAVGLITVGSGLRAERSGRPAPLAFGVGGWILVLFASLFGYV